MSFFRFLAEDDTHAGHDHGLEAHHDEEKPWGNVVLASFLVQLVTLSGVVLFAGMRLYGKDKSWSTLLNKIVPSFATGALLSVAVFLLIPESINLLNGHGEEEEHEDHRFLEEDAHSGENETAWKFGASLLGGFLIPMIISTVFPSPSPLLTLPSDANDEHLNQVEAEETKALDEAAAVDEESDEVDEELEKGPKSDATAEETDATSVSTTKDWSLAGSILLGDALHNFVDGIFIGNAFLLCTNSVAWTIVATTVYHELAQELADFCLLTHQCGLGYWEAVSWNFVSGFSTLIGALIILGSDLKEKGTGSLLAISAGVYLYVSLCECVPRIQAQKKGFRDLAIFVVWFVIGAVPIGLVLLNHGHCEGHSEEH